MWSMLRILSQSQKRYAPVAYAAEYATTLELSAKDLITDTYCNLFVNTRQVSFDRPEARLLAIRSSSAITFNESPSISMRTARETASS